ncbi:hypothetical protein K440DRAFT_631102 [Wilcoxina mikolae CBS 423.85]|nr:hypothetical protein K440DRAFT_631102 [Wilcoxina mikolae CBS 423.85]
MLLFILFILIPLTVAFPLFPRAARFDLAEATNTLCIKPAPWNQILSFFITNYVARIVTYKKTSGYEGLRDYASVFASLFVPFIGISSAAKTIARGSLFLGHTDIDRALLAQALCVITREEGWRPESGETVRGCRIEGGDERRLKKMSRRMRRRRRKERKQRSSRSSRSRSRVEYEHSRGGSRSRVEYERTRGGSRGREMHERKHHDELLGYHGDSRYSYSRYSYSHSSMPAASDDDDDNMESSGDELFTSDAATLIIGDAVLRPLDREKYKIHGHFTLPPNYTLAHLPPGTELMSLAASHATKSDIVLSNSYSVVKAFTGLVQIISSLYTIYSSYGDETARYGFAAFGFTVLPYTVMSMLNVAANIIEASYDCLFLVRSDVMKEAEEREGGEFVGEVAELVPATPDIEIAVAGTEFVDLRFQRTARGQWRAHEVDDDGRPLPGKSWRVYIPPLDGTYSRDLDPRAKIIVEPVGQAYRFNHLEKIRAREFRKWVELVITLFSLITPYVVVGTISKFRRGSSTIRQRVFMVGWLVVGQVIGVLNLVEHTTNLHEIQRWKLTQWIVTRFVIVLGFAFAVGGFVETGRMLREFGYCIQL